MKKKCEQVERLQELHDEYNIHRTLKEIASVSRARKPMMLRDSDGKLLIE